jgi:hypothetical protein
VSLEHLLLSRNPFQRTRPPRPRQGVGFRCSVSGVASRVLGFAFRISGTSHVGFLISNFGVLGIGISHFGVWVSGEGPFGRIFRERERNEALGQRATRFNNTCTRREQFNTKPAKRLKRRPESGLDCLMCAEFVRGPGAARSTSPRCLPEKGTP